MEKQVYFTDEINYISNENKREDIRKLIDKLPDYFFEIPASSTGKYHPKFASGNCGLVKHTKVAVRIAHELLVNESVGFKFGIDEKDIIIMALILHDGFKCGSPKEKYTRFDHPLLASAFVMENKDDLSLEINEIRLLCSGIESHMGQWNYDKYKKITLPKPVTEMQRFIHMCDFLASKKFINVEFNDLNIKY